MDTRSLQVVAVIAVVVGMCVIMRCYEVIKRRKDSGYKIKKGAYGAVLFGGLFFPLGNILTKPEPTPYELLTETAAVMSRDLPKQVDEISTVTEIKIEKEKTIVYLTRLDVAVDQVSFSDLEKDVKDAAVQLWCYGADQKSIRDMKADIIYRYRDQKDAPIGDVKIKTADCK